MKLTNWSRIHDQERLDELIEGTFAGGKSEGELLRAWEHDYFAITAYTYHTERVDDYNMAVQIYGDGIHNDDTIPGYVDTRADIREDATEWLREHPVHPKGVIPKVTDEFDVAHKRLLELVMGYMNIRKAVGSSSADLDDAKMFANEVVPVLQDSDLPDSDRFSRFDSWDKEEIYELQQVEILFFEHNRAKYSGRIDQYRHLSGTFDNGGRYPLGCY